MLHNLISVKKVLFLNNEEKRTIQQQIYYIKTLLSNLLLLPVRISNRLKRVKTIFGIFDVRPLFGICRNLTPSREFRDSRCVPLCQHQGGQLVWHTTKCRNGQNRTFLIFTKNRNPPKAQISISLKTTLGGVLARRVDWKSKIILIKL